MREQSMESNYRWQNALLALASTKSKPQQSRKNGRACATIARRKGPDKPSRSVRAVVLPHIARKSARDWPVRGTKPNAFRRQQPICSRRRSERTFVDFHDRRGLDK